MTRFCIAFFFTVISALRAEAQSLSIFSEGSQAVQYQQNGKSTGFTIELVTEIQRRVGNTDPINFVPWARGLHELEQSPNTLLFSVARTPERDAKFQWIGPITERVYALYARADDNIVINSIEDAKKVASIGVYRNDVRDQALTNMGFTNLDRTDNNDINIKKLMKGRITLFAGTVPNSPRQTQGAGYPPEAIKPVFVFLRSQLYIAASQNTDPAVVAKWNQALADMKKDQSFQKLHKRYFPGVEPPMAAIKPM